MGFWSCCPNRNQDIVVGINEPNNAGVRSEIVRSHPGFLCLLACSQVNQARCRRSFTLLH